MHSCLLLNAYDMAALRYFYVKSFWLILIVGGIITLHFTNEGEKKGLEKLRDSS